MHLTRDILAFDLADHKASFPCRTDACPNDSAERRCGSQSACWGMMGNDNQICEDVCANSARRDPA